MARSASNYTITKRADGRWYTRVTVDGEVRTIYGKTQAEVKAELKKKLWEIEQAQAAQLTNYMQADKITVKQWAMQCLETYSKVSVKGTTYTGCRKGEVIGLQWKDVDFEENIIHISHQLSRHYDIDETGDTKTILEVTDTKTKFSVRDIYMFKSFADEFKAYKEKMIEWKKQNRFAHSEEDFVFVGAKNKAIEPRVFYKYYQEVMENAGIEDCNFHTLRHTFATRCIENGADILMVSRTLGHSNISTTLNKYSHLLPKHQKACMEKLESIYHPADA